MCIRDRHMTAPAILPKEPHSPNSAFAISNDRYNHVQQSLSDGDDAAEDSDLSLASQAVDAVLTCKTRIHSTYTIAPWLIESTSNCNYSKAASINMISADHRVRSSNFSQQSSLTHSSQSTVSEASTLHINMVT